MKAKAKQRPLRVSLCMIARDEERWLADSLKSVQHAVDEIVLVDTGSQDRTREIAAAAGAKVVEMSWQNDFSLARNESLRHATGDWVLVMDADEMLATSGPRPVHQAIAQHPNVSGLTVRFRNRVSDVDPTMQTESVGLRLFRRHPAIRFEGAIHEQVAPSIARSGGTLAHSGLVFNHLGYLPSVRAARGKDERNSGLLRAHLEARPEDVFARFNLATEHLMSQRYAEALAEYQQAWDLATPQDRKAPYFPKLARDRGRAALLLKQFEAALGFCEEALALFPDHPDLWLDRGRILLSLQQYDKAQDALDRALGIAVVSPGYVTDRGSNSWLAWYHKGLAHERSGHLEEAVHGYGEAIQAHPGYLDPALRLAYIGAQSGDATLLSRVEEALTHSSYGLELVTQMHYQAHRFERTAAWVTRAPLNGAVALAQVVLHLMSGENREAAGQLERAPLTPEQQRDARYLRVFISWAEERWEDARAAARPGGVEDEPGQVLQTLTDVMSGITPAEPVELNDAWQVVLAWLVDLKLFDLFARALDAFQATPAEAWMPRVGKVLHLRGYDEMALELFTRAGLETLDREALLMLAEIAEAEGLADEAASFRAQAG